MKETHELRFELFDPMFGGDLLVLCNIDSEGNEHWSFNRPGKEPTKVFGSYLSRDFAGHISDKLEGLTDQTVESLEEIRQECKGENYTDPHGFIFAYHQREDNQPIYHLLGSVSNDPYKGLRTKK